LLAFAEAITCSSKLVAVSFKQVDVSAKPLSLREATAKGTILLSASTVERIRSGRVEKGDPLALARLSGIQAAKKTPEIVLLCHQLRLDGVELTPTVTREGVEVTASVRAHERTGVEMEALASVTVALLNIWDTVKQYEKDEKGEYPATRIEGIRVTRKVKKAL
jgi:cyclic pyranopterin phosphate synthase